MLKLLVRTNSPYLAKSYSFRGLDISLPRSTSSPKLPTLMPLMGHEVHPEGRRKLLVMGNTKITWWENKKYLKIEGIETQSIQNRLFSALSQGNNSQSGVLTRAKRDADSTRSCSCSEISVNVEGLKLDMTDNIKGHTLLFGFYFKLIIKLLYSSNTVTSNKLLFMEASNIKFKNPSLNVKLTL